MSFLTFEKSPQPQGRIFSIVKKRIKLLLRGAFNQDSSAVMASFSSFHGGARGRLQEPKEPVQKICEEPRTIAAGLTLQTVIQMPGLPQILETSEIFPSTPKTSARLRLPPGDVGSGAPPTPGTRSGGAGGRPFC